MCISMYSSIIWNNLAIPSTWQSTILRMFSRLKMWDRNISNTNLAPEGGRQGQHMPTRPGRPNAMEPGTFRHWSHSDLPAIQPLSYQPFGRRPIGSTRAKVATTSWIGNATPARESVENKKHLKWMIYDKWWKQRPHQNGQHHITSLIVQKQIQPKHDISWRKNTKNPTCSSKILWEISSLSSPNPSFLNHSSCGSAAPAFPRPFRSGCPLGYPSPAAVGVGWGQWG